MGLEAVSSPKPVVRVRLLGGFDLRLGEERVPPLDSARAESLLAYLLLHRDAPQQRQHLAFLFWPDSTDAQARTNLRHVLHHLRRELPATDELIDIGPRTLQWCPKAPVWVDVEAFERAIAEEEFEVAVETYAGDLLEGNYDEWLLEERERLAHLHMQALERLALELEQQGRWPEALHHAERLLRHDPLREESHRLLIRLHDACGDPAGALRAYHVCATTMVRELGVEPSAATRETYEALLRAAPGPGEGEPRSPARPPLVGRKAERARLAELWRTAEAGSPQLVLVTGEAGIGKGRLVEELRSWCAQRGAVTVEARAYAAEGAMAYGALATWLRSEPIAARLRRLERVHLTELARLLPDLTSEVPDLAPPEPLPVDEQRQRLFAAAARAIFSAGAPLLLIAEDVHWWDAQTLQFVHYLLRTEPEARLLLVATVRREEIDDDHPVSELIAALQARGAMSEIGLARLSREETGLLAERIAGKPLAATLTERIYDDSEGNPLFLIEALQGAPEAVSTLPGAMSEKVQAVIASRLGRLSEPAAGLVGVAATIGREFTTRVLVDASGASEEALVRGLDELWRRGVVRAHGPSAYDFSHGKIREAAYRALGPAQARHYHLRVADALERSHAGDLESVSGEIAAHHEAAGGIDAAIAWHRRAADAAQRLHASADAVRFLDRALGLARDLPKGPEQSALELRLLTDLPAPLVAVEGYFSDRVADVHERALALAGSLGVEPEAPLIRSLALAALARGEFESARPFGEQLRALAEHERDEVLWVESAYVLGLVEYWQGRLEPARSEFEAALARFRPEQRSLHLLRYGQDPESVCGMRLAHALWLLGRDEDAELARAEALAGAESSAHPYSVAVAHTWAGLIAIDQHDEDQLSLHLEALRAGGLEWKPRQIAVAVELFSGLLEVLDGRSVGGLQRLRGVIDALRRLEPVAPGVNGFLVRFLAEACVLAGAVDPGLEAADRALAMGEGAQVWEAEVRRLRAGLLDVAGAPVTEVEAELERAIEAAERQGARAFERRARRDLDGLHTGTRQGTLPERSMPKDGPRERWRASA